jgi:hypothetical protein
MLKTFSTPSTVKPKVEVLSVENEPSVFFIFGRVLSIGASPNGVASKSAI